MAGIGLNRSRQAPAEDTPSFGAIAERFRRAGDLDRAIALCQEGLKKFPNQLSARVTLGWAFLDKGEYDHARQELERVIRRAPDNLAAIRGLAELHDRAEHAVSGLGPDGMWVPAEDFPDELDAAVAASQDLAQAAEPVKPEPGPVMPAAPPPLPVPAITSANDDVNPLSLIETPAQAAVAHSGYAEAEPVVSVFEQVIEHAADAVLAASAEPVVEDAADWSGPEVVVPADTPLAALQAVDEAWEPAIPASASEPANDAVVLAEDAEVELARVATELGMAESDPVIASDVVIDLPEGDDVLAGALMQFEAAPEAEETAAFDATALDPVLPPDIDAADELEALGSVFAAAANEPEPEEVLQLEEEELLVPHVEPVLAIEPEPDVVLEPSLAVVAEVEEAPTTALEPSSAAIEIEEARPPVAEEAPEESPVPEPVAALEAAAEPEVLPEVVPDIVAQVAAEPEELLVSQEVAPEEAALEPAAVPESELVLAPEPIVAPVVDATSEAEPEPEPEPEPEADPVVAADAEAGEPDEEAAEPLEVAAASGAGEMDEVENEVAADSGGWDVPEVPWMPPPAGEAAGMPAMATTAVRLTDEQLNQLFPAPPPQAPAAARVAPIAALERFLHKVNSRRLHLSPNSVA